MEDYEYTIPIIIGDTTAMTMLGVLIGIMVLYWLWKFVKTLIV